MSARQLYEEPGALLRVDQTNAHNEIQSMPAKILIVEDEMLVAMNLEAILEDIGHEPVGIVPDLDSAEPFYEAALDLALVDLNLRDGLTGPQIAERLTSRGVPVLFITANPRMLGDGVAGTIGVITKPTDPPTVQAAVAYVLGLREGRQVAPPSSLKLFG